MAWSLNWAGALRSALSMVSTTSAWLRAGLGPAPPKMTSSIPSARMALAELAPMTQRRASSRLDLPQPFGPTMPVSPGSMRNSVASTKDLKPARRNRWKCTGPPPSGLLLLQQRLDFGVELGQRLLAGFQLLAIDDEGRGAVDLVDVDGLLEPVVQRLQRLL